MGQVHHGSATTAALRQSAKARRRDCGAGPARKVMVFQWPCATLALNDKKAAIAAWN